MRTLLIATLFFIVNTAKAELPNIVALVNKEPITRSEFMARRHMIMALNNIDGMNSISDEARQRLNQVALKSLIDESLLTQVTKKPISEDEVNGAIRSIEERNKMPDGSLLKFLQSKSVNQDSYKAQIRGELMRMNIVSSLSRDIHVSPKEINTLIFDSNQKDVQISARIFESKNRDDSTLAKMNILYKNLKNCSGIKESLYKDFATMQTLDEQLSKLDKTVQTIVKDLNINQASKIFEMNNKFNMVLVCDKKVLNFSDDDNAYVTNLLTNKKISQKAQKFFDDLHKKAYIKIMLPT